MAISNTDIIWERLLLGINNAYGAAALMGNLFAESSLNPLCKTGGDKTQTGQQYASMVNEGVISGDAFAHDGVAFGLAQWRYWSRKEQLYLYAREKGRGIDDIDIQLDFLLREIQTYKTVWNTITKTDSIRVASDMILERYEKPANVSEAVKKKRAAYGQGYFDQYMKVKPVETTNGTMVVTTHDNVNLREGNGTNYPAVGRCSKAGTAYPYVATSADNWHAIVVVVKNKKRVVWVSGDYAKIQ